jgi:hypothetical protein
MKFVRCIALVAVVLLMSTPLFAESLVGADKFICAVVVQEVCASDAPCTDGGPAWDTKIPEFLEFDLEQETVGTTSASGEGRRNKVNLRRDGGLIIMQAYELGKAFSLVVNEVTGILTASVTSDGEVITVFAACTPK